MIRRFATFVLVAGLTSGGLLWWLHDGDWRAAIAESSAAAKWDADALAHNAGIEARDPEPVAPSAGVVLELDAEPAGPAAH